MSKVVLLYLMMLLVWYMYVVMKVMIDEGNSSDFIFIQLHHMVAIGVPFT